MRLRWMALWLVLGLLIGCTVAGIAQEQADTPKDDAPPNQIKGKTVAFTLLKPEGWQSRTYEKLEEAPNAKMIVQGGLGKFLGEDAKFTDNHNLWWSPAGENMMTGLASFHRIELKTTLDLATTLAVFQQSPNLPAGMEIKPAQLGKYVGLLGGGVVRDMFYAAVVLIPGDKVLYVSSVLGPKAQIAPQWANYMKLVASLNAPDLKPQKLKDVFGDETDTK